MLGAACRSKGAPCTEVEFIEDGLYTSAHIALGRDGLPYVLILDNTSVVFLHCDDSDCRKTTRKVLAEGVAPTSVALAEGGRSELPWISFRRKGSGDPPAALQCRDEHCAATTPSELITTERRSCEDTVDLVRWKCDEPACHSRSRSVIAEKIGKQAAVVESKTGVWIFDRVTGGIAVRQCATRCVEGKALEVTGTAHLLTAMKTDDDGVWLAVLDDFGLRVAECRDRQCRERAASPQEGSANTLAMLDVAPDRSPVVFLSKPNRLIRCPAGPCTERRLDAGLIYGFAVPSDDRPLFVVDAGRRRLRVLRCTDPSCAATTAQAIEY